MPTIGRKLRRSARALVVLLLMLCALTGLRFTHIIATEWVVTMVLNLLALALGIQITVVSQRWQRG
jgi:hypothetical protein